MNILFVCTGNTCRSPMAEHLFRKMLRDAGKTDVTVASAGIMPTPELGFPKEARDAIGAEGVVSVDHRAQPLSEVLVKQADVILAMEKSHRDAVANWFPTASAKTYVLNDYAGLGDVGIRDPYGQSAAVYVETLAQIKRALQKILSKI